MSLDPGAIAGGLSGQASAPPDRGMATRTATADLRDALEGAGDNRPALEAVLAHYRDRGDSLALRAAEYLIANMQGHSFVRFGLFDSTGRAIDLDILAHPDYDALVAHLDEIERRVGTVQFERMEIREDLKTIQASLLIENIDWALRAWRERPWASGLPFDLFCEFVLPYRGSNEPLESWRPYFLNRYASLADSMKDPRDAIEAARLINDDLRRWFRFDPRYYHHPTDQGLSEMLAGRMGRCEDMTNLTIYAMRANGLAVTSDYTPAWADAGNNHAWNAILDARGNAVIFMGAEAQPGEYALSNKAAKIYRKTYSHQRSNLAYCKADSEPAPGWLTGRNYEDVTASYLPVHDVSLSLSAPVPDSSHFAYICVFNSGEWQAVDWARIEEGGRVTFRALAGEIAYLAGYYSKDGILPAGAPFILQATGAIRPLLARKERLQAMALTSTTRRSQVESTEAVSGSALEPGHAYELFYWDGRWVLAGAATAASDPLLFEDVPADALYWLVEKGSRKEERIFSYEGGKQVWW
ncbi:MAG: transglutaminase domain-containing protein [Candidatus Eisenbacteria bacterium]|nr:transglutaminase domain-containing protein [Candidatus Eisenbacteria bacterium]